MKWFSLVTAVTILALLSNIVALAAEKDKPSVKMNWSVKNGQFFTEANGFPLGSSPKGYSITDDEEAQFWSEFQRLGGVDRLGYPASRRFMWGGFITQVTQKALLQWRPDKRRVNLVNVFDDLSKLGKDDWLHAARSTPWSLEPDFDKSKDWNTIIRNRLALLKARPAMFKRYESAADPLALYGLPTSRIEDMGNHYAIRLQRAVIQEWKVDTPWAKAGEVTVANAGDILKETGTLPFIATWPENPPPDTWDPAAGYRMLGKATWYGGTLFHGQVMANGQAYDENDPTTIASNAYPLGSRLRVRRLDQKAEIIGVVRDTGGFKYPIIVDLSKAGFVKLGGHPGEGVIGVEVELLPPT